MCGMGSYDGCAFPGIVPRTMEALSTNSSHVVVLASDNFSKIKSSAVGRLLAITARARPENGLMVMTTCLACQGRSQDRSPNLRAVRTTRPLDRECSEYQTDPSAGLIATLNGLWRRIANALVRWPRMVRPFECPECNSPIIARSARHGRLEKILKSFRIVPWRCLSCRHRFFGWKEK